MIDVKISSINCFERRESMEIDETIYMDQAGYDSYLEKIEAVKNAISENNKGRREAFDAGAGDGWDSPEFEEIERVNTRLNGELQKMYQNLQKIVIIEKHNDEEVIDIGDILVADMKMPSGALNEIMFKLVGAAGNLDSEIQEVSINSPLGNSVYKKKIGDTCSYSVGDRKFTLLLKQKINSLNKVNSDSGRSR